MQRIFSSIVNKFQYSNIYILGISGLAFWFIIGFPFANRNESYGWIVLLEKFDLIETLSYQFPTIATFRPLAQATAWLLYNVSESIFPIQVLNFITIISGFVFLLNAVKEKRTLSIILFFTGGMFFTTFYFMFNLHGIFYGPMILLASLLINFNDKVLLNNRTLVFTIIIVFTLAFVHPYSLLIYAFFLVGTLIEKRNTITKNRFLIILLLIIMSLILTKLLVPGQEIVSFAFLSDNLIASLINAEAGNRLSIVSFAIAVICAFSFKNARKRLYIVGLVVITSIVLYILSLPVLIVLILISLYKMYYIKKWSILFLILVAVLFPAVVITKSPIKCFLIFPIVSYAIAVESDTSLQIFNFFKRRWSTISIIFLVFSFAILIRTGQYIPLLSQLTLPIQQEREKTFQLERILEWKIKSEYEFYGLILGQPVPNLVNSPMQWNRKNIPPTNQAYLDDYLNFIGKTNIGKSKVGELIVYFGTEKMHNYVLVYSLNGMFAGDVYVYLRSH